MHAGGEVASLGTTVLAGALWLVVAVSSVAASVLLYRSFVDAAEKVNARDPKKAEEDRQKRIDQLTGRR